MADKSTRYKMNVRSPYYVVADTEGIPTDIQDDPDTPDEYQQPDDFTQDMECGNVVNVGDDVGTRKYRLDADNRTGNVSIAYNASVPIKISAEWNGNTVQAASGDFVGDSVYQQQLQDAGIELADMSLALGGATGNLIINKSSSSPSIVTVTVKAPLKNDEYDLTFNCPPRKVRDNGTLPATPDGTKIAFNVPAIYAQYIPCRKLQVYINGTLAHTETSNTSILPTMFVITDNPQLGNFKYETGLEQFTRTVFIDKSTYMSSGNNTIELRYSERPTSAGAVLRAYRGGIYHNGSTWGWATQQQAYLYEYEQSPEQTSGIFAHQPFSMKLGERYGQAYFRQLHVRYQWYEETGSATGYFGETITYANDTSFAFARPVGH